MTVKTGDWVRIERDEERWPSKGTWPNYRGKVGRVVTTNRSAGEYGVQFTAMGDVTTWFLAHELTVVEKPRRAPKILTGAERFAQSHTAAAAVPPDPLPA